MAPPPSPRVPPCAPGPAAGRASALAGGEELQGDRAADPGRPLPPGRLRVPEQHRRLQPGLCRPHHNRLGFPQRRQDLQPDFPRENARVPSLSVSATGRAHAAPGCPGSPLPPCGRWFSGSIWRQIGCLKSLGWGKAGSGPGLPGEPSPGFQTTATPCPSLARPCPVQPPHVVRAWREAQSGWTGRWPSSLRHPHPRPPPGQPTAVRPAPGCAGRDPEPEPWRGGPGFPMCTLGPWPVL